MAQYTLSTVPDVVREAVGNRPGLLDAWVRLYNQVWALYADQMGASPDADGAAWQAASLLLRDHVAGFDAAERRQGLMVGLWLDPATAARLALPDGEAPDDLHITLAHCGDVDAYDPATLALVRANVQEWAADTRPVIGGVVGSGRFAATPHSDGQDVYYAAVALPEIGPDRDRLLAALRRAGVQPSTAFAFTPHITLAYVPPDAASPPAVPPSVHFQFPAATLCLGPERLDLPFLRDVPTSDTPPADPFNTADHAAAEEALMPTPFPLRVRPHGAVPLAAAVDFKYTPATAPDNVKAALHDTPKRLRQWCDVWNSAYDRAKADGAEDSAAEGQAFRLANGVLAAQGHPTSAEHGALPSRAAAPAAVPPRVTFTRGLPPRGASFYSDEQPRDEHGRFAPGGGGAGVADAGPHAGPATPAALVEERAAHNMLLRYGGSHTLGAEAVNALKARSAAIHDYMAGTGPHPGPAGPLGLPAHGLVATDPREQAALDSHVQGLAFAHGELQRAQAALQHAITEAVPLRQGAAPPVVPSLLHPSPPLAMTGAIHEARQAVAAAEQKVGIHAANIAARTGGATPPVHHGLETPPPAQMQFRVRPRGAFPLPLPHRTLTGTSDPPSAAHAAAPTGEESTMAREVRFGSGPGAGPTPPRPAFLAPPPPPASGPPVAPGANGPVMPPPRFPTPAPPPVAGAPVLPTVAAPALLHQWRMGTEVHHDYWDELLYKPGECDPDSPLYDPGNPECDEGDDGDFAKPPFPGAAKPFATADAAALAPGLPLPPAQNADDSGPVTKTEDGADYPASAYAYVPDPAAPSTWKLRLWASPTERETAAQVGAAAAALGPGFRGNKVEIPADDRAAVVAKVRAAWKRQNPDKAEDDMPDGIHLSADGPPRIRRTVAGFLGSLAHTAAAALGFDAPLLVPPLPSDPLPSAEGPYDPTTGETFPREAFAYAPADDPHTWCLRMWELDPEGVPMETRASVDRAVNRFAADHDALNSADALPIPEGDLPLVRATLRAAWLRTHPEAEPAAVPDHIAPVAGYSANFSATFDRSAPVAVKVDGDGTPMVLRPGKIFEVGTYPDKGFALSSEEMDAVCQNFRPVPVDLSHVPTVLDGKMGRLEAVERGSDGKTLFGIVALPQWLDDLLEDDERKVSASFDRLTKRLVGLALVTKPRVPDAALFGAYAAFAAGRHDTPSGQAVHQQIHDMAAMAGAVCKRDAVERRAGDGTTADAAFHASHELDGLQVIHDEAVRHGAQCAGAVRTDMGTPPNRYRRGAEAVPVGSNEPPPPTGVAAACATPAPHAPMEDGAGAARPFPLVPGAGAPMAATLGPDAAGGGTDYPLVPRSAFSAAGPGTVATGRAPVERKPPMVRIADVLQRWTQGGAKPDATVEELLGPSPERAQFDSALAVERRRAAELAAENRRMAQANADLRLSGLREQAASFARDLLRDHRITPAEESAVVEAYVQAGLDDMENGPATFMDSAGVQQSVPRVARIEAVFAARPAHMLTQEQLLPVAREILINRDRTPGQPRDERVPATPEKVREMIGTTARGRALLEQGAMGTNGTSH